MLMTNKIEKLIDLPSCCKQREQCPGNCNKCIAEHLIKNGAILQKHGRWIILPHTEQCNYKCSNLVLIQWV